MNPTPKNKTLLRSGLLGFRAFGLGLQQGGNRGEVQGITFCCLVRKKEYNPYEEIHWGHIGILEKKWKLLHCDTVHIGVIIGNKGK